MSQDPSIDKLPIDEAVSLLKKGDIKGAQLKLGLPLGSVTNKEFTDGMISLKQGLNLCVQGLVVEASEHLQKALPIISKSTYKGKIIIIGLASFTEGISRLHKGDAHGALKSLDISADVAERLAFFVPHFKKIAMNCKIATYIALARADLNSGNLTSAESWVGKTHNLHQQLLKSLDPENIEDIEDFVGIYATRLELANSFAFFDAQVFDLDDMERRLKAVSEESSKLQRFIQKIQPGIFEIGARGVLLEYSVLQSLHGLEKDIILGRSPVTKDRIKKFQRIAQELFEAEEIAKKLGEQGKGHLAMISRIKEMCQNLLAVEGKTRKKDFGRFSGIISFCSFVVVLIVINLAIQPSGLAAVSYFLGALIISLVAGFGYGAIRFRPLLKLYSETLEREGKKED
ncbi:MAG: hypothetical protein JSV12_00305 [Candidatus Bathyarchaeota archaeon]|nr:MAG: hypothetical protein JSV12_00305 [Candidatus Bathyarchaeota archaeon]